MGIALSEYSLPDDFKENMEVAYIKGRSPSLHRVLQGFSAAFRSSPLEEPSPLPLWDSPFPPKGFGKVAGISPGKFYIYMSDILPMGYLKFQRWTLWRIRFGILNTVENPSRRVLRKNLKNDFAQIL